MNKNLQDIYTKVTGKEWVYDFDVYYAEEFAKEIVKECVHQIQLKIVRNGDTPENIRTRKHIHDIVDFFGIDIKEV